MAELRINIDYCSKCPYHELQDVHTADSFENESNVYCKKLNEVVYKNLDWYEPGKVDKVPETCPLLISKCADIKDKVTEIKDKYSYVLGGLMGTIIGNANLNWLANSAESLMKDIDELEIAVCDG